MKVAGINCRAARDDALLDVLIVNQVAALPYRCDDDGQLEVMLITSRRGQRWIPPKGDLIAGLLPHEAAAPEAYEEAGIFETVEAEPVGRYAAVKLLANGDTANLGVTMFAMRVDGYMTEWPERSQRAVFWFESIIAARIVRERGPARLIEDFHPLLFQSRCQRHCASQQRATCVFAIPLEQPRPIRH